MRTEKCNLMDACIDSSSGDINLLIVLIMSLTPKFMMGCGSDVDGMKTGASFEGGWGMWMG